MLVVVLLFLFLLADIRLVFAAEVMSFDPTDPSGNGGSAASLLSGNKEKKKEEVGLPKLSTIILGKNSRLAVIDGQRIKEKDQIGGYIVKTISRKEVVLVKSGKEVRLLLPYHFEGKVEDNPEKLPANEDVVRIRNSNFKAS